MRVQSQKDTSAEIFSKQLLNIGNGKMPVEISTGLITLPIDFYKVIESKNELITKVFPNIPNNYKIYDWLSERAILAPKNIDDQEINNLIQNEIVGDLISCKSIDSVTSADQVVNYPIEFLNSLNLSALKVESIKMMLKNINQPRLCNGTRLVVKKLMSNIIEATIIKGKYKGEDVLMPRIPMIPTDLAFGFKRLQFPVQLAFAMTINKSQGQSLEVCGLYLENQCFSHGQLYVACSRVGKPSSLFIYLPIKKVKNILYKKALE